MGTVIRSIVVYLGLLVVLRASGKRTLAQTTTFDLVLLLIISEAIQQGMIGNDFSLTTALLTVATLVGVDMTLAALKNRFRRLDLWVEGRPVIVIDHGRPIRDRMKQERINEHDVLAAARESQGLERLDQIKYAVLERSGGISIIPN